MGLFWCQDDGVVPTQSDLANMDNSIESLKDLVSAVKQELKNLNGSGCLTYAKDLF